MHQRLHPQFPKHFHRCRMPLILPSLLCWQANAVSARVHYLKRWCYAFSHGELLSLFQSVSTIGWSARSPAWVRQRVCSQMISTLSVADTVMGEPGPAQQVDPCLLPFLAAEENGAEEELCLAQLIADVAPTIREIVSRSHDPERDYRAAVRQVTELLHACRVAPQNRAIGNFSIQVSDIAQRVYQEGQQHDWQRLLRWLDKGEDSDGRAYEEMRRRLMDFFARKGCRQAEELADKTFDRVTRWLVGNNRDYDPEPARICYQTAKYIFLEHLDQCIRDYEFLNQVQPAPPTDDEKAEHEQRLECLEHCLKKLPTAEHDLILAYYASEQRKKALAVERDLTYGTLRKKAFDIRQKLADCVTQCLRR